VLSEVVDPDIHSSDFDLDCLVFCRLGVGQGKKEGTRKVPCGGFRKWTRARGEGGVARGFEVGKISGPERSVNFEFLSCVVDWFGCSVRN
jgi:hypothetical protein